MRISLSQTTTINNYKFQNVQTEPVIKNEPPIDYSEFAPKGLNIGQFYNVSFGIRTKTNKDIDFLLSYSDKLKCAYSGKPMISKAKAKELYQKIDKRPNAQSAINLLQHIQDYMHDIESIVFDLLCDAPHKNKRDFHDILQDFLPNSLEQLKIKETEIINKANPIIKKLSEPVAEQVTKIRDEALEAINNDTFGRKTPLEKIKSIKAEGKDLQLIRKIYQKWYQLPASSKDLDAFIVQYSKKTHNQIAKRLISSAVATIEHIRPSSRRGDDNLGNYLLVSAEYNMSRATMPLSEYIELNKQIKIQENLQKYIDTVIEEVNDKRTAFYHRSFYPDKVRATLKKESNGTINLDISRLQLSKEQVQENKTSQKLINRYKNQ